MAQRLNKKLVVGLTIAAMMLMTICGFALIYLLPPPDPTPFVQQGKQFEAEQNYDQATLAYQNAAERARRAMASADGEKRERLRADMVSYRIHAGDMAYQAGKAGQAIHLWDVVIRDDPSNETAQMRILTVYLDFYRLMGNADWSKLEEEARKLADINKDHPNPTGLSAWGLALVKQRSLKPENASQGEKLLKQAVDLQKGDPELARFLAEFYLEDARVLLGNSRPDETYKQAEARIRQAEDVYEQLKANLPSDPSEAGAAWRNRGVFYLDLRNLLWVRVQLLRRGTGLGSSESDLLRQLADADRKSLESLEQAARLAPTDAKSLWGMGDYWAFKPSTDADEAKRKTETDAYRAKAIEGYKKAISAAPDDFEAYLRLASLYRLSGKLPEAGDVLQARIDKGIRHGTHLEFRNRVFMLKLREELFDIRFAQTGGLARDGEPFKTLLQSLRDVQYPAYVNEAEGREENGMAKFMKARLATLEQKYAEALEAMKQASTLSGGTDPTIQLNLAQLYLMNQAPGKAEELLREIVQTAAPNHDGTWALLASIQSGLGKLDDAQISADRALQLNPQNRDALLVLGRIYHAKGNQAGEAEIRRKLNLPDDTAGNSVQEANALFRTADPANIQKAKAKLHEVLKADPIYVPALRQLAIILAPQKDDSEVVKAQKLQEMRAALDTATAAVNKKLAEAPATQPAGPGAVDYKRVAASIRTLNAYALAQGDEKQLIKLLAEAFSQEPDSFERANSLAQLYVRSGENDKAIDQLRTANQLHPKDAGVLDQMFNVALARKETWAVAEKECIPKLIELGSARAGGRFYRGRLGLAKAEFAARDDNLTEAKSMAAEARGQLEAGLNEFPSYPDGLAWLGQAQLYLDQYDQAHQSLAKALELDPNNATAVLLMYQLSRIRGDESQQRLYLRRLAELRPDHPLVLQQAQEKQDDTDPAGAIKRREQLTESNPNDVRNWLALAGLYYKTGQVDKARAGYEKCRKLQPENLEVIGRYAMFLRDEEKKPAESAAAEQLLRQALEGLKDPGDKAKAQLMLAGHLEQMGRKGGEKAPTIADVAATYEAAAKIHETPEILLDIADFYIRVSQAKDAEAKLRRAIEISNTEERRELNRKARRGLIQVMMVSADDRLSELDHEIAAYGQKFTDGFAQVAHSEMALAVGRTAEAIEDMNTYVSKLPQEALGFYRRGFIQHQRGALTQAIDDLRKAASFDPQGFRFAHRQLLARSLAEANQPDVAIAQLSSILEETKNLPAEDRPSIELATVKQLIELRIGQKQWTAAEADLLPRSMNTKDPNRITWLRLLATIYVRQGDASKAVQAARDAVEASSQASRPATLLAFADLCISVRRPQDAIQYINQKAPADLAKEVPIQVKLAEAHAAAKETAQALQIYNQVLDRAGGNLEDVRAIALSMVGAAAKEAPGALQKRLASRPDDRDSKFALALVQMYGSAFDEGQKAMNALLAGISSSDNKAKAEKILILNDLCSAVHSHRDFPTARKLYEQLLAIEPNNVMCRNNLAFLLVDEFKEPQKALEQVEVATRNFPPGISAREKAIVLDTVGWTYGKLGNFDMAISRLQQAISLFQTAPEGVTYTLAGTYYHLAEGFYGRSQAAGNRTAQADREEAILACRHAWRLLRMSDSDPDNVRPNVQGLAEKLQATLEEKLPTSQAAMAP